MSFPFGLATAKHGTQRFLSRFSKSNGHVRHNARRCLSISSIGSIMTPNRNMVRPVSSLQHQHQQQQQQQAPWVQQVQQAQQTNQVMEGITLTDDGRLKAGPSALHPAQAAAQGGTYRLCPQKHPSGAKRASA
eukprot:188087_1